MGPLWFWRRRNFGRQLKTTIVIGQLRQLPQLFRKFSVFISYEGA
jgi:hypothetical protein